MHYLLFYDPYKAAINWAALAPYFFGWGEVIINHMDSDTRRAVKLRNMSNRGEYYLATNNTHGEEIQQSLFATPPEDKQCYTVSDIADYIVDNFKGRSAVPLKEIYAFVDDHPVFPTDGCKPEIKAALKLTGRCKAGRSTVDFA